MKLLLTCLVFVVFILLLMTLLKNSESFTTMSQAIVLDNKNIEQLAPHSLIQKPHYFDKDKHYYPVKNTDQWKDLI